MNEDYEIQSEKVHFSDKELLLKVWFSPRALFEYINAHQINKFVPLLLVLAGISRAFDRAINKNMGDESSLVFIILVSVIGGGLLGWISFYIYSALISWMGKWLGGKAGTEVILRVIAYAMIPAISTLFLLIIMMILFGKSIFISEQEIEGLGEGIISLIIGILFIVLGVWSMIATIIGVSVVQQFSIGKAFVNVFLPVVIFAGIILFIVLIASTIN